DRQGRGNGNVMLDQVLDQGLDLGTRDVDAGEAVAPTARTFVGLLVRIELGIDKEPVLEVVDAEGDRFGIGDSTEMPGKLGAALVRLLDGGAEGGAVDAGIRLEPADPLIGPVVDLLPGVVRTGEMVAAPRVSPAVQIRT